MISLRRSIDQQEVRERLLEAALGGYAAAVQGVEEFVLPAAGPTAPAQEQVLRSARKKLHLGLTAADLAEVRATIDTELRAFSQALEKENRRKAREVKAILEVMADATQAIAAHTDAYSRRFLGLTRELEALEAEEDLSEIHRRLSLHVRQLKECVGSMSDDSKATIAKLSVELDSCRARLTDAEVAAQTDPLTGCHNRRAMERQLSTLIQTDRKFCIVLFDLDNFKAVNSRFGHLTGDAALREFARRLRQKLRPDDMVCRWGGDEFLVFFECAIRDAMPRARQLAQVLSGRYQMPVDGREVGIELAVSAGVAEYRRGEASEQLFERADALLFHRRAELSGS